MRSLLGEKDNRRLELIEEISWSPGISLSSLSSRLKQKKAQIIADINYLNTILNPLVLEVNAHKQCYLQIPIVYSMKKVYQLFLENSLNFAVIEAIFVGSFDTYEYLAKKLFVSKSTLKRTVTFINKNLSKYQMKISGRPIKMMGNEENIRAFYYFYFLEKYPDGHYPFDLFMKDFIDAIVHSFQECFSTRKNFFANNNRLKLHASISAIREKDKFTVEANYLLHKELYQKIFLEVESYPEKNKFKAYFKQAFTVGMYKKIFRLYLNGRYAFSMDDFDQRTSFDLENKELFQGVKSLIQSISKCWEIPLEKENDIVLHVYNVIALTHDITVKPYIIYPHRKLFLLKSYHLKPIFMGEFQQLFCQNLKTVVARNDEYFYEIVYLLTTYWPHFFRYIMTKAKPCKIGIFYDSDIDHMRYIRDQLKFLYGDKIEIIIIEVGSIKELALTLDDSIDLLLINFFLGSKVDLKKPHLSVTDLLAGDDLTKLTMLIDQFHQ